MSFAESLRILKFGFYAGLILLPTSVLAETPPETSEVSTAAPAQLDLSGFGGVTESGAALGVGAKMVTQRGAANADLMIGAPILRLNGDAAFFHKGLGGKEFQITDEVEGFVSGSLLPLAFRGQVSVPASGDFNRSHAILNPQAAATSGACMGKSCAALRVQAGPAGGVAHDGDGSAGIFGAKVGISGLVTHDLNDRDRLQLSLGTSALNSFTDRVGTAKESNLSLGLKRRTRTGERVTLAIEAVNARYNVLPLEGVESVDNGKSRMLRLRVVIAR